MSQPTFEERVQAAQELTAARGGARACQDAQEAMEDVLRGVEAGAIAASGGTVKVLRDASGRLANLVVDSMQRVRDAERVLIGEAD